MSTLLLPDVRAEWLAERKKGIGASDAAGILGLSPWTSPFSVWLDKTTDATDDAATEAMEWGLRLEDAIAAKWEDVHGIRLDRVIHDDGRPRIVAHADHPWMVASLDRRAADGNPFEAKTASPWDDGWDDVDAGLVPDHVTIQQQHQIAVTGAERCYGAVLIAGSKFHTWVVERDDRMIADIIAAEQRFWESYVLADRPPPLDGHQATNDAIKTMFPESAEGQVVELPVGAEALLRQLADAKVAKKATAEVEDGIANQIKTLLGDAEAGTINGLTAVTWKSSVTNRLDLDTFRKDHPDLAAAYTTATPVRTLRPAKGFK